MLNNNSNYKSNSLIDTKRNERKRLLNPYEYNFESNLKDKQSEKFINNCFNTYPKLKK